MYPGFVETAHSQLDTAVGPDRLPTFNDRSQLPYIEAVLREVLRWRPSIRCGVPHATSDNDEVEYNGHLYFIPKGTTIFCPVWSLDHDEKRYTEPNSFRPERFLDQDGNLQTAYEPSTFGFGRRVCPGIPFAERVLFINIAMILWLFNVRKSTEADPKTGQPFVYDDSDTAFDPGSLSNDPYPFPAVFEPRDMERVAIARREWQDCEKDLTYLLSES